MAKKGGRVAGGRIWDHDQTEYRRDNGEPSSTTEARPFSSPSSLLAKVGREKEALTLLANIQSNGNEDDPMVIVEWEEIITRKFVKNGMWKRTTAGMTVQAWQQLAGANVIVYYSWPQMKRYYGHLGTQTERRTLLVYAALGMGLCHFIANIVIAVDGGHSANTVIFFSFMLIVIYDLTLAPVCWIYAAEVFSFALNMFTPPAFVNITWRLFIIFGVLCILASAWFWVFYPDTCGKTLEEVEIMFKDRPKPWKTRKGESRLQAEIEAVIARREKGGVADVHVAAGSEKNDETRLRVV
ncbi:hypothetical protein B0T18DRAFT_470711 [Schizothecium vesticola]|uniref:Uncharacterized protein n=1 Tax=Schizothecium vesticola TaxID=314040 RepID=A0AA40EIV7_9PEZI|nr:hypothetical protein B0T18DRAFT_470711 [Schizothecium vesticola]